MSNEKNKVALSSVIAAVFLTAMKLIVGLMTGSLGILSEALHSGLDLVAAIVTMVSVRISDKPADNTHHYGHGKIENLSALFETGLLLLTSVWIIYEAVNRLQGGEHEIIVNIWSYLVVIISIIVDISRSRALSKAAKKHNSQALEADALHFSTDILSSFVVLLGLILSNFGIYTADSIAALMVAVIVIVVSIRLGIKSVSVLLDTVPAGMMEKVESIIATNNEIDDYRDIRIRTSGADVFINLTVLINKTYSLEKSHEICDLIENDIALAIPRSNIHIHVEPTT